MLKRGLVLAGVLALAGCYAATKQPAASRSDTNLTTGLPPVKYFAVAAPRPPQHTNAELARDFNELTFFLESGRPLNVFSRFEGPVTLSITGEMPASLLPDLRSLMRRLRSEAGIDISITQSAAANIMIQTVPSREMRRHVPEAACFVVPGVSNWEQFTGRPDKSNMDWARLKQRKQVAIFVPSDRAPQEQRDCLHEEIAQALGPLNDIFRLRDSVFNDDNIHAVLTGYDMLMLRVAYDPALKSGMSPAVVSRRVPDILARINPAGNRAPGSLRAITPPAWKAAMTKALSPSVNMQQRQDAAARAIQISSRNRWSGPRRGFSHYAFGRLMVREDRAAALASFKDAYRIYSSRPDMALHRAVVAEQLAAFALTEGDGKKVLNIVNPHLPVAAAHQDAELLSALLMFRAEGLELTGRVAEARAVRLDSLGWARYAYGSEALVRRKLAEVTSLNPTK